MYISQIWLNRYGKDSKLTGTIEVSGEAGKTTINFTTEEAVELMHSLKKILHRQAADMAKRFDEAIAAAPAPLLLETKTEPA